MPHERGRGLQTAKKRETLVAEPVPGRLVAVTERCAARLEAHGGAEQRRLVARGLDQVELGTWMLDPQGRQAELQEVLAVDAAGLLHDRVEAAAPQRDDAA